MKGSTTQKQDDNIQPKPVEPWIALDPTILAFYSHYDKKSGSYFLQFLIIVLMNLLVI